MQWGRKFERSKTSEVRSFEARSDRDVLTRPAKGEWQGVRGNSLIASAQYNYNLYDSYIAFNTAGIPGRTDLVTQKVTGESGAAGERQVVTMKQTRGSLTWYKPNSFYGNHELKTGLEYSVHGRVETKEEQMVNYHLYVQNGVPYQFLPFNAPTQPSVFANMFGSYLRDSWTVGRRLTLNLGLRFDWQEGVCAGAVPRSGDAPRGRRLPRRVLPEGTDQDLDERGAAPSCRLRSVGRWQDGDQGWVGALRSHAPAGSRRVTAGREQSSARRLPVARPEREPRLRSRRGQPRSERARFRGNRRQAFAGNGVACSATEPRREPEREAAQVR